MRTAPVQTVPVTALQPYQRIEELVRAVHDILAVPSLGRATTSQYQSHNARHPGFLVPSDLGTGDGGITALMLLRYLGVKLQNVWTKMARKAKAERLVSPEHTAGGWDRHQKGGAANGAAAGDNGGAAVQPIRPDVAPEPHRVE